MANDVRYVKDVEAAKMVDMSPQHFRNMRCRGEGPPYVKLGHWAVRYKVSDLEAWSERGRVTPAG